MADNELALDSVLCWSGTEKVTVQVLLRYLKAPECYKQTLADIGCNRLTERYITPSNRLIAELHTEITAEQHYEEETDNGTASSSKLRLGFSIMANMCLLIETFQAFKEGKAEYVGDEHQNAFVRFFKENHEQFEDMDGEVFYKNIRCSILHQGETTDGWRITTQTTFIDNDAKCINAHEFLKKMGIVLKDYKDKLADSEFETPVWNNYLLKLHAIVQNCEINKTKSTK